MDQGIDVSLPKPLRLYPQLAHLSFLKARDPFQDSAAVDVSALTQAYTNTRQTLANELSLFGDGLKDLRASFTPNQQKSFKYAYFLYCLKNDPRAMRCKSPSELYEFIKDHYRSMIAPALYGQANDAAVEALFNASIKCFPFQFEQLFSLLTGNNQSSFAPRLAELEIIEKITKTPASSLHTLPELSFLSDEILLIKEKDRMPFVLALLPQISSAIVSWNTASKGLNLDGLGRIADDFGSMEPETFAKTYDLHGDPLSPQARTFIAAGLIAINIGNARLYGDDVSKRNLEYAYHQQPALKALTNEKLAEWKFQASLALETIAIRTLQKDAKCPIDASRMIQDGINKPKKRLDLPGQEVESTEQFARDLQRYSQLILTPLPPSKPISYPGKCDKADPATQTALCTSLSIWSRGDQNLLFHLQELATQTPQNIATVWLDAEIAAQTGIGNSMALLNRMPNTTAIAIRQESSAKFVAEYDMEVAFININAMDAMESWPRDYNPNKTFSCRVIIDLVRNPDSGQWETREVIRIPITAPSARDVPSLAPPKPSELRLEEIYKPLPLENPEVALKYAGEFAEK